jgi:hypothetical protein
MKSYPKIRGYANYNVSRRVSLFLLSKEFPNVPKRKQTAGRVAMAYNYCLPKSYRKIDKDVCGNNNYTRRLDTVSKNKSKFYFDRPYDY